MKHIVITAFISATALISTPATAGKLRVEVTNLTNATYFTPLLIATHARGTHLFEAGQPASPSLQAAAEGGDIDGLIEDVEAIGGRFVADPAGGLLEPGATASAQLKVKGRRDAVLSLVAMLLPTNDGFVGLDSLPIPRKNGVYVYYLNGFDAGTEANDEVITDGGGEPGVPGIPADPGGNSGMGAAGVTDADHNESVHVHRGIVGGEGSDLDRSVHRWINPVAQIVLKVGRHYDTSHDRSEFESD